MAHVYIIYRIVNKINNKFYIGVHRTKDVNDGYLGSGHNIKAAIVKYGIEHFKKEILHIFTNKKEAFKKEKELVAAEQVNSKMCYNIKEGGYGGFDHIRSANLHKSTYGTKVMHHPDTNEIKKIKKDLVNSFIQQGWVLGYSKIAKERMSQAGKIKVQTIEHRRKNSESKKNSIIMINNHTGIKKFIKRHLIQDFINQNWSVYDWKFLNKTIS
jgi:hypothetical protein